MGRLHCLYDMGFMGLGNLPERWSDRFRSRGRMQAMEENPYKPPTDQSQGPPKTRMTFGSYVGAAVDILAWIALLLIGIGLIGAILAMFRVWR